MLKAADSPPRFSTLVLLAGLSVLSLTMFLPSLPSIAAEFDVSYALVSLSIAGYLATTAVVQLIMGPLSDRYGRRPVLLTGLLIFALASLGCAFAPDIRTFLAFRVLQAAIISGYTVASAIVRDTAPTHEAASRLGYINMAMAIGPILGPMLGGLIDELFGWRAGFVVYAAMGLTLFAICWRDLGETHHARSASLGAQFRAWPALVGSGRFWAFVVCMAFTTGTFYTFLAGAPVVAQTVLDLSPAHLGFWMGTITGGFLLGSFLSGRYARVVSLSRMMLAGRMVAGAGLACGLVLFFAGYVSEYTLFGATVFAGLGNGLTMPSSNAGALSIRPDLAGSAAGLAGAVVLAVGAVLTALTGALLSTQYGAHELLGVMLACTLLGGLAAFAVLRSDRRLSQPCRDSA